MQGISQSYGCLHYEGGHSVQRNWIKKTLQWREVFALLMFAIVIAGFADDTSSSLAFTTSLST